MRVSVLFGTAAGLLAAAAGCGGGGGTAAVGPCGAGAACPAGHFCGSASRTCVAAVVEVVTGAHHSCAAHGDGRISCWGLAESLNAGGGSVVAPAFLAALSGARGLAAGTHLTCAITGTRNIRCWGNQAYTVALEDGRPLGEVAQVTVGPGSACAASPAGVHCWGKNDLGQLARPLELPASPLALLADAGARRFLGAGSAVIAHDGVDRLCAWGNNATHLVTADDVTSVYSRPVCGTVPDVAGLTVGADYACVRHAAGTFSCWGERYYGQLGLGGSETDTEDVVPHGAVTALGAPVTAMVAGKSHTCALLAARVVTCFGLNSLGQVGPDPGTAAEEVRAPATVSGFSGAVISLGGGSSAQHTCAIVGDGSVACWGDNADGQLGNGVTTRQPGRFSATPVAVGW